MSALAVKALVYHEQLLEHRRTTCRRCRRSDRCPRADLLRTEFERIRKLALMPGNVWWVLSGTPAGRAEQDRIATEEGMAVLGMELVNGRRRKIRGWPEAR